MATEKETIMKLIESSDVSILRSMLASGEFLDVNILYDVPGFPFPMSALHFNSYKGNRQAVEFLLSWTTPADVNLVDKENETALYYAARHNQPDVIKILLDHGGDRGIKNIREQTPEEWANRCDHKEAATVLRTYFPDISAPAIDKRRNIVRLAIGGKPADAETSEDEDNDPNLQPVSKYNGVRKRRNAMRVPKGLNLTYAEFSKDVYNDSNLQPTASESSSSRDSFDIYLCHSLTDKPLVSLIYKWLTDLGYRVCYDLLISMNDGIAKSRVVLACVGPYPNGRNSMFELREAKSRYPNKNIVTLALVNMRSRDNPDFPGEELTKGILLLGELMYCDISRVAQDPRWKEDPNNSKLIQELKEAMMGPDEDLLRILVSSGLPLRLKGSLESLLHPKEGLKVYLDLESKLKLIEQISLKIANFHRRGKAIGDLKPSRIRLDDSFNASLFPIELCSHMSIGTDIYAFAIVSWEIMTGLEHPLKAEFDSAGGADSFIGNLCEENYLHPLDKLPPYTPPAIRRMISLCWNKDPSKRLTSEACHAVVTESSRVVSTKQFDVFLSHAWSDKIFVDPIYEWLTSLGYRVWYDINEMGYNMIESMKTGIANSSFVLLCFSSEYETSRSLIEAQEASRQNKPIVTLLAESLKDWTPKSEISDDILKLRTSGYCDISRVSQEIKKKMDKPSLALLKELIKESEKLIQILDHAVCTKSYDGSSELLKMLEATMLANRQMQAWGRSRINMMGDGAAGKTALSYSLRGKPQPKFIGSTIGIETFSCDIFNAEVMSGKANWQESNYSYPEWARVIVRASRGYDKKPAELKSTGNIAVRSDDSDGGYSSSFGEIDGGSAGNALEGDLEREKSRKMQENKLRDKKIEDKYTSCTKFFTNLFCSTGSQKLNKVVPTQKNASDSGTNAQPIPQNDSSNYDDVMKCLTDEVQSNSKCRIALYDYGGQDVFNSLHRLFMTRLGVYTVVFNMELMLNDEEKDLCLNRVKFWLDSIAVYTLSEVMKKGETKGMLRTAPVALVGTRKDIVASPEDHFKISQMLLGKFQDHIVFTSQSILKSSSNSNNNSNNTSINNILFFPVNNLIGRGDPSIVNLMSAIEMEIDSSDYVHVEKPTIWLQSYDKLKELQKPYLLYDQVAEVTRSVGLEDKEVPELLQFLHNMGIIMWHDEESLRNVIIMDVMKFFVSPTTIVICDHEPTVVNGISRSHIRPVHMKANERLPRDYKTMKETGIVSEQLMELLLEEECGEDNLNVVKELMVKYGLICGLSSKITSAAINNTSQMRSVHTSYLVPVLLPLCQSPGINNCWKHSFCFIFATSTWLINQNVISWNNVKLSGFLPHGFFESFICRAVTWSQDTMSRYEEININQIFKDTAILRYGGQRFRLTCLLESNCIQVDVEGDYPIAVYKLLEKQMQRLIAECMKSLMCIPTLLYRYPSSYSVSTGISSCHVSLNQVSELVKDNGRVDSCDKSHLISGADLKSQHPGWFNNLGILPAYDVFISHRWPDREDNNNIKGMLDEKLVESIYDRLTLGYTVGSSLRAIDIFLDSRRIPPGKDFLNEFSRALTRSVVIVPILSKYALERLVQGEHESDSTDCVLVEWIMSLECFKSNYDGKKVMGIFPILIGTHTEDKISNIFKENDSIIHRLSTDPPVASIATARRLLKENNIPFDDARMEAYTVKSVVGAISSINGCEAYKINNEDLTVEISEQIKTCLLQYLDTSSKTITDAISSSLSATAESAPPRDDESFSPINKSTKGSYLPAAGRVTDPVKMTNVTDSVPPSFIDEKQEFDNLVKDFGADALKEFTALKDIIDYSSPYLRDRQLQQLKESIMQDLKLPTTKAAMLIGRLDGIYSKMQGSGDGR